MAPRLTQSGGRFTDLSRLRYLIVGKNGFNRGLLIRTLRNFSATDIRETSDIDFALDMIRTLPPDVIFLDVVSSREDELRLLQVLHESTWHTHIPTIILSESAHLGKVITAIGLGADSYIAMPYSAETVETHLLKVLKAASHPGA